MKNQQLTIIVGDTDCYLSDYAKTIDPSAYLIEKNNISVNHNGVVYVSLGDIDSLEDFYKFLKKATRIVYHPPTKWSDQKTNRDVYSIAWFTEHCIRMAMNFSNIQVDNLPAAVFDIDCDIIERKTNKKQMWVAGCSTTFGAGVNKGEKYWEIIQQKLNLDVTLLANLGASNSWCRDQLLRCNINKDDIVVWGLTTTDRFSWIIKNKLHHINQAFYSANPEFDKIVSIDTLGSFQRIYETLTSVCMVVNFCNKIGAKLVIANIHGNLEIIPECQKFKEFLIIHGVQGTDWHSSFLDFGWDNKHPGPRTHNMYALKILEKMSELKIV